MTKPRVLCILGPTGSGKSDLAVAAARAFDGEVVNADSMQVFRHLPIGTAAPSPDQLEAAPHHLFSVLDPDADPDAGWYAREAARVIAGISARGRVPIVVGGTFFWVRALFRGLDDIPPVPQEVHDRVRERLAAEGPAACHAMLRQIDPVSAARLQSADTQRIARALEVFEATGRPLSSFQQGTPRPAVDADVLQVSVGWPREALYARIDARVDRMFRDGLLDEVRRVLDLGFSRDIRPFRTASYLPVVRLAEGAIGPAEARDLVARGHRHYAKRQVTWLRAEPDLLAADGAAPLAVLPALRAFLDAKGDRHL